jgi:hypothetical protein
MSAVAAAVFLAGPAVAGPGKADDGCSTGTAQLRPVHGVAGRGTVTITGREGFEQVKVHARLPRSKRGEAYEVWLYESRRDAVSIGAARTNSRGMLRGAGPLPAPVEAFGWIDISREKVDGDRRHSGHSVLRARLRDLCD